MGGVASCLCGKAISLATRESVGLVDQLLQKAVSLAKEQVSIVLDLDDEIEFLRKVLPKLNEIILNAEVTSEEMAELRGVLKDFADDAEDILDEFDTELTRRRPSAIVDRQRNRTVRWFVVWVGVFMGEQRSRTLLKLVCGCIPCSLCFDSCDYESVSLFFYAKIANQIKGLYGGFEKLKSDVAKVRQFVDSAKEGLGVAEEEVVGSSHRPITYAWQRRDLELVGREEVKKQVIDELLLKLSCKPSVVLVTGMGGIGKTAFIQDIFATPDFDQHFQIKKWMCIGDELNPEVLMGGGDREEILQEVKGKRFLIVLDDCWKGKLSRWNELWDPLSYGGDGSKVVITSREDVSKELVAVSVKTYALGVLSNDECLKIFESYAFPDGVTSSSRGRDSTGRLREIGRKIVDEKIRGIPLAARVVGSSLRNVTDVDAWNGVLEGVAENDVMSVLMWSYRRLPSHLKQCFSYLALFPKDCKLEKAEVVRMWMAQGYIRPQNNQTFEYIGKSYFDDLIGASLVQFYNSNYEEHKYIMHDLVHDLAMMVSGGEFFLNDRDATQRHLILKKPRAFICNSRNMNISEHQFQYIRVLSLFHVDNLTRVNFSNMIHLRYLDLSGVQSWDLPESICAIHNLQTLLLFRHLENFPSCMWKLPNLRHLEGGLDIRMAGIGCSTSLQTISFFKLVKEKDIEELENLDELCGKLHIQPLNYVRSNDSALKAQLKNKKHIEELLLHWEKSTSTSDELQNTVLESLRPHENLRILEISNYMGGRSPGWLGGKHLLKLVKVTLFHLHHLKKLPPLGHLRHLEYLYIKDLKSVRCIGYEFYGTDLNQADIFPSLKELHLEEMDVLDEWKDSTFREDRINRWFPSLELLDVSSCAELRSLPRLPKQIRRLSIEGTGIMALPEMWTRSNDSNICCFLSLEELKINSCPSLYTDKWFRKYQIPSLFDLVLSSIGKCTNLVVSYSRKCLKSLAIENMPALESITLRNLAPSEQFKEADYQLSSISLDSLNALSRISVVNCEDGKIMAGPLSLSVIGCNNLHSVKGSKFMLDGEYTFEEVVNFRTDKWEFLLKAEPRKLVNILLHDWDMACEVPYHDRKRLTRWFQNLSSTQKLIIQRGPSAKICSWPPYMPLQNLRSLQYIRFIDYMSLLESFPELPPSAVIFEST